MYLQAADLSQPTTVSEDYLLGLEREAFVALCTERKTLGTHPIYFNRRKNT